MIKKRAGIYLYIMFFCVFFWDILEDILPKSQFIILFLLFIMNVTSRKQIRLKKKVLLFIGVLLFHGLINVIIGNDSLSLLLIQIITIMFSILIFDALVQKNSISSIMNIYLKYAVFTSVIGVIEEIAGLLNMRFFTKIPLFFTYTNFDYRVAGFLKISSICREPSFLGYILAPAACMIMAYFFFPEFVDRKNDFFKSKFKMCIVLLAYIFTFSSVAYFGILIMFLTLWFKNDLTIKKIVLPIIVLIFCGVTYFYIPDVQVRVDDTLAIFSNDSFSSGSVNLSSYTLYSNYGVTLKTLKYTNGFGSGIGSYRLMFDKFEPLSWGESNILLNREDANSGLFRIASETGIVGLIFALSFVFKYLPTKKHKNIAYSVAFFSLILMYLLRQGNYTHAGSILFIILYIKNYKEICTKVEFREDGL